MELFDAEVSDRGCTQLTFTMRYPIQNVLPSD